MSEGVPTEQQLREAAFRGLVEHGYAELSIADIGEEFGRSPSLIYHYYEDKDDLLLSMLETFTDRFVDVRIVEPIEDAEAELRDLVEYVLDPAEAEVERDIAPPSTDVEVAVARVYVELWSRATWDPEFRERVAGIEDRMRETIEGIIHAGVDEGHFHPVDADETAQHLLSLLQHALHVRATTGREDVVRTIEGAIDERIRSLRRDE